jgi:hypothetical protein
MLLSQTSPLRRLPKSLPHKQVLFFDGLRFAAEMTALSHWRLVQVLAGLSMVTDQRTDRDPATIAAMLDAWSMVDSVHRFRELLHHMPGIKRKSPSYQTFRRSTASVEALRNAIQHLRTEIDQLLVTDSPVWGSLGWFSLQSVDPPYGRSCSIVAGAVRSGNIPLVSPSGGKTLVAPVDVITLTAAGHSVSLTDIARAIEQVVRILERSLGEQFPDAPHHGSDLMICAEIHFVDPATLPPSA